MARPKRVLPGRFLPGPRRRCLIRQQRPLGPASVPRVTFLLASGSPSSRKRVEQLLDTAADDVVDHEEIRRKREHGRDHDSRGCPNLFPGGPRDAFHLEMQLLEIILHFCRPAGSALRETHFFAHCYFLLKKTPTRVSAFATLQEAGR